MSRDWALSVKNLLLPIHCKACDQRLLTEENGFFCPQCWESSPLIERPFCSRCGRPHQSMVGYGARSNFPCADCRARPSRYIRRIYGAAVYDGAVEMGIKLLKFSDKERLAGPLAELLTAFAEREMDAEAYALLIPVPLHRVRERSRGFNQSRLLAERVLPAFPRARLDESLRRIRPTRVQTRATGKERRANVRGAFAVLGDACKGKTVLLVDDVVTTGSTVSECAAALHRAGAANVDVLAVALTVPRWNSDDEPM